MAGIDPRTMRRYFEDVEFRHRYQEAFGSLVQDATRQAQQIISPALDVLKEIMRDKNVNAAVRAQAAKGAVDLALRLTEQNDILEQLRELEKWRDETDGKR